MIHKGLLFSIISFMHFPFSLTQGFQSQWLCVGFFVCLRSYCSHVASVTTNLITESSEPENQGNL